MHSFKKITNKTIGEVLIERGIINHEQLNTAIDRQNKYGGLFGEILVELNFATEVDIAQAITCQYGFPYLPLSNYEIDGEVIEAIPQDICRQYCLVPVDKIGKSLTIAMANPLNMEAIANIELLSGCTVQTFVSTTAEIKQAIEKYFHK